jgi:predicted dehydrogenase
MLKTAQVGLGWWGMEITRRLQGNEKIQIVCGVDPFPATAEKWAAAYGLPVYPDYQQVLDAPNIDAVILTSPHVFHEEQVLAACAAGKQIFCEKPLTLSADSVRRMLDACDKAGVVMGVGHERRFEPGWAEIKRMVDAGELGTIMHVEGDFSHDKFLALPPDSWRGSKTEAPAAGMTGMGVHLTDVFLSLVGPVVEVHAHVAKRVLPFPTGDVVSVHLLFADGTTGHIAAVSATPFYGRLALFGSDAWVEARETQHTDPGGPVHLFTRRRGDAEQAMRVIEPKDGVVTNLEEWADAAAGNGSYRWTNEQRFGNVAILEAVISSAESGKPVQVAQY